MLVKNYFAKNAGVPQEKRIRGDKAITPTIGSARLHVCSHGKKLFVIALQYEGEEEYRYLVASDLTWRTIDIVEAYSQRWLVEVFIQDWKANEGWATLTKLQGENGSRRGMILRLLVGHCLFFHPDQLARFENKLPAFTGLLWVACGAKQISKACFCLFLKFLSSEEPREKLVEKMSIMQDNLLGFEK